MSNLFLKIGLSLLGFLLAGCTFSVSASDPLHLTVEVAPAFMTKHHQNSTAAPETKPTESVGVPLLSQPQRYISLHSLARGATISATAVVTTQQLLIAQNVITPLQSIGLFTPSGKIRLAVAHVFSPTQSVSQTLLSDTDWVLFVPTDLNSNIQSWEQILITPSVRSNAQTTLTLAETHYSLRHNVGQVISFASQATAQDIYNTIGSAVAQWSTDHPGQALWVALLVTEEELPGGKTGLVLRRFVDRGANPAPENEQVYYCTVQLACPSADSVGEVVTCWWNGC